MPWFDTEYLDDDPFEPFVFVEGYETSGRFRAHLWARDSLHANELVYRRRIGENVLGIHSDDPLPAPYERPSTLIRDTTLDPLEVLHSICFLCFLAEESMTVTSFETTGDRGVLHEALHLFRSQDEGTTREGLAAALEIVELEVPGFWPTPLVQTETRVYESDETITVKVRATETPPILSFESNRFGRCKDCRHFIGDNEHEAAKRDVSTIPPTCRHPSFRFGYQIEDEPPADGLHVEGDEGWCWIVGPEFGCVHFERAPDSLRQGKDKP